MSDFTKTKYSMTAEAKAFFAREDVRAFIDAIRAEFPDAQFCDDTYSSTIDPAVRVPGLIVYSAALDRYVSASIGAMGTVRSWLDPEHVKSCIDRRYWDNAFLSGRAYCDENGEAIGAAGAGERFLVDGPYVHGDGRPVYRATDAAMSVLNGYSAEWVRAELDLGRFLYECEGIPYAWTGVNEVTDDWRNAMRDGRAHPESAKRWLEREANQQTLGGSAEQGVAIGRQEQPAEPRPVCACGQTCWAEAPNDVQCGDCAALDDKFMADVCMGKGIDARIAAVAQVETPRGAWDWDPRDAVDGEL
jgi:rubredoxin